MRANASSYIKASHYLAVITQGVGVVYSGDSTKRTLQDVVALGVVRSLGIDLLIEHSDCMNTKER